MANNLPDILDKASLFLRQQAELYGGEMFIDNQSPDVDDRPSDSGTVKQTSVASENQNLRDYKISGGANEGELFLNQKPHSKGDVPRSQQTIKVSEDAELFEGAVLKPEWKIDAQWRESGSLQELDSRISGCLKCSLGSTRKKFVFGVGNPKAKLVLIGEAPGADEDEQGEPFVGRAGQLLNKILVAVQLRREDVFICNILKCRPPNNRDPLPGEVESCEPFLKKQLGIINPKLILCLGRIAGQTLLKTNATLSIPRRF